MDMNFEAMRVNELKTAFAKICAMHSGNETRAYIKGALVAPERLRGGLIEYRNADGPKRESALLRIIYIADLSVDEAREAA